MSNSQKVVFAAMSKRNFYLREYIVKFVLDKGYTPTCAFMMFSYFLLGTVDRDKLIRANNELIRRSDELWAFGEVSDGVQKEIELAKARNMPILYYTIDKATCTFSNIPEGMIEYEDARVANSAVSCN